MPKIFARLCNNQHRGISRQIRVCWDMAIFVVATLIVVALLAGSQKALAVVATASNSENRIPFNQDLGLFRSSLALPARAKPEQVSMSERVLRLRTKKATAMPTIEPLQLFLTNKPDDVAVMANRLARSGQTEQLTAWFNQALNSAPPVRAGSDTRQLTIDSKAYALIDPVAFAGLFTKIHHNVEVDGRMLQKDEPTKRLLLDQIQPYLDEPTRAKVARKIQAGESIPVDTMLLPEFARRMVRRYIVYKGPNCFHAALSFQSPLFTRSSLVNVKEEEGYHRAMINYDELWRAIGANFYEIDTRREPLKYGDMLVFFDIPKGNQDNHLPVDYRWIRHAATYLFNGFTFSKGSKSPNTPYAVRTLAEEWATWQKYSKNLGVKVYRRNMDSVDQPISRNLVDWVY